MSCDFKNCFYPQMLPKSDRSYCNCSSGHNTLCKKHFSLRNKLRYTQATFCHRVSLEVTYVNKIWSFIKKKKKGRGRQLIGGLLASRAIFAMMFIVWQTWKTEITSLSWVTGRLSYNQACQKSCSFHSKEPLSLQPIIIDMASPSTGFSSTV